MDLRELEPQTLDLRLGRLRHLPEVVVKAMAASLERHGQLTPLMACDQEGALLLVDGFVRQRAATQLGWSTVRVEVVQMAATQMKAQLYLLNRDRGLTLIEECRLLRELSCVDDLTQTELADLLLRHKSWISRRLTLVRLLSPALLEDGLLCELSGGCISSLAKLQLCNQEEIWAVCQKHQFKPVEVAQVVELYRRAPDGESRGYVLSSPLAALALRKGRAEQTYEARLGKLGGELFKLLRGLARISVRVQNRRFEGVEACGKEGQAVLYRALLEARTQSTRGLALVEELLKKQGDVL